MADIPVFSPPREPTTIDRTREVRTLQTDFGDGYQQVCPDGLNPLRDTLTVKWDNLTVTQAMDIDGFFQVRSAAPFSWQPPQQPQTKLWRCKSWSVTYSERYVGISAQFEEVFS